MNDAKRYRIALDEIINEELPLFNKRLGVSYDNGKLYRLFMDGFAPITEIIEILNFEEFSKSAKDFYRTYEFPNTEEETKKVVPSWGKQQGKLETIIKLLIGTALGFFGSRYGF